MASRPTKNRERAFRNMMRKIISDLWKGQLHNAAQTPSEQPLGRKSSYIHIARDNLQRLDLFKPAQFLHTPHNQLPLLRLRTQSTSYISTHFHLSNTLTYTPYVERYCSSCLPLQILGNEAHTLLHCPHSSPLAQPAIHSLMLNLRRFDLWAWATYTDTPKVAMLLRSIPPKLDRQHEMVWVLITFPTCTQLIYSFNLSLVLPNPLSSSLPPSPPLSCPRLHHMIFTAKYVRVRLTNIKCFFLTFVTQDGLYTAFSHPLPPSHMEPGNASYASRATSYPRQ